MSVTVIKSVGVLPGAFDTDVKAMFNRHPNFRVEYNPRRYGCDVLCFTGGDDIHPALYGQTPIRGVHCSPSRDSFEVEMFEFFRDVPKIGICRGAQLLNVLSGGSMWQDTDGHQGAHQAYSMEDGEVFRVSSIHHQMMVPGKDGTVLLVADESSYVEDAHGRRTKTKEPYDDIEAVWYPTTKSFLYQGHPEIGPKEEVEWFFDQFREKLEV